MDRRNFLKFSGLGIVSFLASNQMPAFSISKSHFKSGSNKVIILLELKGGNDGLNTVIPYSSEKYYELRPNISIKRDSILQISNNYGLNPKMNKLINSWKDKDLAIILGVGYPKPNRSHFRSIEIWDTASNSNEFLHDGWVSRLNGHSSKSILDGVILGENNSGPLSGEFMKNIYLSNLKQFFNQTKNLKEIKNNSTRQSLLHILNTKNNLYQAANLLGKKINKVSLNNSFPKYSLANQLEVSSKIIKSRFPVDIIKVTHNGFDTHINQTWKHDNLLKQLSDSLYLFKKEMKSIDRWNDIIIMTYSEFGRRASENGSRGTDHGTAAPHFVLGGQVNGGVYGKYPDLNDLNNGDLQYNVDFRSIYKTISKKWFNSNSSFLNDFDTLKFL